VPRSAGVLRDAQMMPLLLVLWQANYSVYGARKLQIAARRAGLGIGRDQVVRLMRQLGIRGVQRTKTVATTRTDPAATRPGDLVERDFAAAAPNLLWVSDLTHVAAWSSVAYVCFITDAFSRCIVGWRVASNTKTQMVLDALETARQNRPTRLEGLVAHTDAGSHLTSIPQDGCPGGRVESAERVADKGHQLGVGRPRSFTWGWSDPQTMRSAPNKSTSRNTAEPGDRAAASKTPVLSLTTRFSQVASSTRARSSPPRDTKP